MESITWSFSIILIIPLNYRGWWVGIKKTCKSTNFEIHTEKNTLNFYCVWKRWKLRIINLDVNVPIFFFFLTSVFGCLKSLVFSAVNSNYVNHAWYRLSILVGHMIKLYHALYVHCRFHYRPTAEIYIFDASDFFCASNQQRHSVVSLLRMLQTVKRSTDIVQHWCVKKFQRWKKSWKNVEDTTFVQSWPFYYWKKFKMPHLQSK